MVEDQYIKYVKMHYLSNSMGSGITRFLPMNFLRSAMTFERTTSSGRSSI